jgi:CheY-like chemotaxis protein
MTFTERSSTGDSSKTRLFFRSLLPARNHPESRIRVDGLMFVPEEIKSKKILVVDDDAVILKTLTMKLKSVGYQVVNAVDASDAIRAMREERPDVVIMDIYYPPDVAHGGGVPWDGFILMRWLRAMEQGQRIPVIFITGSLAAGFKQKALAVGALGLFEKPIDHVRLFELIQRALSGRTSTDSSF